MSKYHCEDCIYLEGNYCHFEPTVGYVEEPENHWCSHLTREAMDNVGTFDFPQFVKVHVKPYETTTSTFRA